MEGGSGPSARALYIQVLSAAITRGRCLAFHTSNSCSLALIISCRFVLSSRSTACLYCHLSGTKGHFISFASSMRVLKSGGSQPEKVKVQVSDAATEVTRWHLTSKKHSLHPSMSQQLQPVASSNLSNNERLPVIRQPLLLCPAGKWSCLPLKEGIWQDVSHWNYFVGV